MKDGSGNFILGVFLGALVGTAAGMLVAPQKGEETREQIKQKTREMHDEMQAEADNLKEEFTSELKRRAGEALNWSTQMVGKMDHKIQEVEGRLSQMQEKLDESGEAEA